jgi:hypothetical protein
MKKIKPKHIAWLLPFAYLVHLSDEYFSGAGFHIWFSEIFDVNLSLNDFILINLAGFAGTIIIVILYSFDKVNSFVIAALGSLFFLNGLIHLAASLLTSAYSPGTISGLIIYLPLGFLIFKSIFPLLPEKQRVPAVTAGIMIQVVIALIALSI